MLLFRRQRGFTLVELVMTIVVIGLVAIPLAISLTAQVQGTVESALITQAMNLARYEIERVNNLAFAGIASVSIPNYNGYPFDVSRNVTYVQGSDATAEALKKVVVSVTQAGSATPLATLTTYIAKNIVYQ